MTTFLQLLPIIIAIFSLMVAYLSFRAKKVDKFEKDLADRLKSNALADAMTTKVDALANYVSQKETGLSDAIALEAIEIKELQTRYNILFSDVQVLKSQIENLSKLADKTDLALVNISDKIDEILKMIYDDRRNEDDSN